MTDIVINRIDHYKKKDPFSSSCPNHMASVKKLKAFLTFLKTVDRWHKLEPIEATDNKLQAVANKCGLSKLDLFTYMVDYFYKTKKDPRDLNDDLLKNALNRKTDNIVAFIKTQEQDLLSISQADYCS